MSEHPRRYGISARLVDGASREVSIGTTIDAESGVVWLHLPALEAGEYTIVVDEQPLQASPRAIDPESSQADE